MELSRTLSILHGLFLTLADRMWHKMLFRAEVLKQLPKPRGPYHVGCADVMTGSGSEGVFVRLFYPCTHQQEVSSAPSVVPWIPDRKYVDGLAGFVRVWPALFRFLFRLVVGQVLLPVRWKAAPHPPPTPCGWPALVFSHGLGGCRTTYSTLCAELASRGFVVAATEHRDRTACMTFTLESSRPEAKAEWVEYRRVVEGEDAYAIRNAQAHQRASECVLALDLLLRLNAGSEVTNALEREWIGGEFRGLVDGGRVGVVGHSFGGATLTLALGLEPRFRVGVALDAWMYPVRKEPLERLTTPLLLLNMERFQTEVNVRAMRRLGAGRVVTLRGGAHQNPSDVPFLSQHTRFHSLFNSGTTLPPLLAINVISALTLHFLCKHLDLAQVEECEKEIEANSHLLNFDPDSPVNTKFQHSLKSFL